MMPRVPREPYPGLRPFLDFESVLLFGRDRQLHEVIERLRESHFVAVLGGSGSGKSSLIMAGVVPELRSFGIPGAGDFWLPMVCTPGTNVAAADLAQNRFTPISRLAWKFSGLLRSRGSPEEDAARREEIAAVFRQPAGFARLVDTYTRELQVPPGPDAAEARLLFVVDQFEELFHPTNKGVADAERLVERVIDHFFNPHPRCYVVLTMRSEHLNDCAGYLELPDAINKSSYLVRRLDDDELREVIVGPAQRLRDLIARDEALADGLPEAVRFEEPLLETVVRDTREISTDPDHLPLLQHLLARLWEAALARDGGLVPAALTMADLRVAVGGEGDGAANTLRASLENRAQAAYQTYDAPARGQIDLLFARLAFKDPNTGLYSQQRVNVADCAAIVGAQQGPEALRALIAPGFLKGVDYLYWDDENPSRVTLKVSHESFIRGWRHFRELVNAEAERFEELRSMLRQCADWVARGRPAERLLDAGSLQRLQDVGAAAQLADPGRRAGWLRFLLLDRDGERLTRIAPEADGFLALSLERRAKTERGVRNMRVGRRLAIAAALVLLPLAGFSILIQQPVSKRSLWLFDAGNKSQNAPAPRAFENAADTQASLRPLLDAAVLVDRAATGDGWLTRLSQPLLEAFDFIGPVRRQSQLLDGVRALVEPPINGKLRQLLAAALWDTDNRTAADRILRATIAPRRCLMNDGTNAGRSEQVQGFLLTEALVEGRTRALRRLFVTEDAPGFEDSIAAFVAGVEGTGCNARELVTSVPKFIDPFLAFDANLRYFVGSQSSDYDDSSAVTLYEIEWSRSEEGGNRVQAARDRAILADRDAVARVKTAAGSQRVAVVPTWRKPAGWAFEVGGQSWRVASTTAQLVGTDAAGSDFAPLAAAAEGSWCRRVSRMTRDWYPPNFKTAEYVHGSDCFVITRGQPPSDTAGAPSALDEIIVAVYREPAWGGAGDRLTRLEEDLPAPVASMAQFARLRPQTEGVWHVGVRGVHAGWLALRVKAPSGELRYLGGPWSTCALWRQGRDFLPAAQRRPVDDEVCAGR